MTEMAGMRLRPSWTRRRSAVKTRPELDRHSASAQTHCVIRSALACCFLACLWAFAPAGAREEQGHGLDFEDWVAAAFFEPFDAGPPTRPWDIPAAANTRHGNIPANPKFTKYRSPVGMGDALRQFDVNEPFLLIVGFWEQTGPREKTVVNLQAVRVEPAVWRALWGEITRADLEELESIIKDRSLGIDEARAKAKEFKARPPFTGAAITVNPKIDGSQRRLQCSLPFRAFFERLAPQADRSPQAAPELFDVKARTSYPSTPRGG